jgi:N-methylhydantoinase A
VTDADLVLGYLDPKFFLGGRIELDLERTRQAIQDRLAAKLGLSIEQAAWGIHQIVNETMASAARAHVLERGKDPHTLPLFAFGGAGPVHGYRIAQALGAPRLIAPLGAGIMSTLGFLSAPAAFDFVRPWRVELEFIDWYRADELLGKMESAGRALLREAGIPDETMRVECSADMRYIGQGHEIIVALPQAVFDPQRRTVELISSFEKTYQQLYGRQGPPVPQEILNWRVTVLGPKPEVNLLVDDPALGGANAASPLKGERSAYFPELGGFAKVPVFDRYGMRRGLSFQGPAIIEERESTTVVGPDGRCHIDEQWNLVVELK